VLGGLIAGSLAVVTDATHMASDLAGFLISLVAIWLSRKSATHRLSFGFYRAGIHFMKINISVEHNLCEFFGLDLAQIYG